MMMIGSTRWVINTKARDPVHGGSYARYHFQYGSAAFGYRVGHKYQIPSLSYRSTPKVIISRFSRNRSTVGVNV